LSRGTKKRKKKIFEVQAPIILICSRGLSVIPWELLFLPDVVIRSFTYKALELELSKETTNKKNQKETYTFLAGYNSGERNQIKRKKWTKQFVFNELKLMDKPMYGSDLSFQLPFNSTLIKSKRKTNKLDQFIGKYLYMLDFQLLTSPSELVKYSLYYSNLIFIFTYTELLELSETLVYLHRYHPPVTMIFIPGKHVKDVITKFCTFQHKMEKGKVLQDMKNKFQLLLQIISSIETNFKIPICVVNPPYL